MSKKANVIEAKGVIYKESGNGYFNVELDEPDDVILKLHSSIGKKKTKTKAKGF